MPKILDQVYAEVTSTKRGVFPFPPISSHARLWWMLSPMLACWLGEAPQYFAYQTKISTAILRLNSSWIYVVEYSCNLQYVAILFTSEFAWILLWCLSLLWYLKDCLKWVSSTQQTLKYLSEASFSRLESEENRKLLYQYLELQTKAIASAAWS